MLEAAGATAADVAAHLVKGHGASVLPFGALEQHARSS